MKEVYEKYFLSECYQSNVYNLKSHGKSNISKNNKQTYRNRECYDDYEKYPSNNKSKNTHRIYCTNDFDEFEEYPDTNHDIGLYNYSECYERQDYSDIHNFNCSDNYSYEYCDHSDHLEELFFQKFHSSKKLNDRHDSNKNDECYECGDCEDCKNYPECYGRYNHNTPCTRTSSSRNECYDYSPKNDIENNLYIFKYGQDYICKGYGESTEFCLDEFIPATRVDIHILTTNNLLFWGEVRDKYCRPAANAVVTLLKISGNNCDYCKVSSTLTDEHGFYNFIVPRSKQPCEFEVSLSPTINFDKFTAG